MAKRGLKVLHSGRFLALLDRNGWEFAERVKGSGVVAIVAVTAQDELILTEQFRPSIQKNVIDLPAGLAGDVAGAEQESFLVAAKRELEEETGFVSREWETEFTGPSSPGLSTEMISFFLALHCQRRSAGGGEGNENIKVHVIPRAKLAAWLKRKSTRRTCVDPKVYAAVGLLALR